MSAVDQAGLVEMMASVADALHNPLPMETALSMIVASVQQTIPQAEYVGIALAHRSGRIETLAATDEIVHRIDVLQEELGEGPTLDRADDGTFNVENLVLETRWPGFRQRVAAMGVASQMGVELYDDGDAVAVLTLYAATPYAFDEQTSFIVALFATHAAQVLGRSDDGQELLQAAATRQLIGEAIGVVMERYGLDEQQAFLFLTRVSQQSDTPVVVLADGLVNGVRRP
jgi:hypothetical protein